METHNLVYKKIMMEKFCIFQKTETFGYFSIIN